jgi:hypothetical protein
MVWNKSAEIVLKGLVTYLFVIITAYSGRWCARLVKVEHNWRLAITSSLLIMASLSFITALVWDKLFFQAIYFHSELVTISTPIVILLMGAGMLLYFLSEERRKKEGIKPETEEEKEAASETITPSGGGYVEEKQDYIFIKAGGKSYKAEFNNLLYAEANRNNTKVVFLDKTISTAMSFSAFEKLLPVTRFIRVHRSFIVNKEKITCIEGNRVFLHQHEIPIGESYREGFYQLFNLI